MLIRQHWTQNELGSRHLSGGNSSFRPELDVANVSLMSNKRRHVWFQDKLYLPKRTSGSNKNASLVLKKKKNTADASGKLLF